MTLRAAFDRWVAARTGWGRMAAGVLLLLAGASHSATALECIAVQERASWPLPVDQPSDLAPGPSGDLYLVDGVNHRVVVVDTDGRVRFTFGTPGSGPGQMQSPVGIDIAGQNVFIADTGNHRIQIFDLAGRFVDQFEVSGTPAGKPSDPVDVLASGLKNRIYVADNDNHNIKVFDGQGRYLSFWGGFGEGSGEFRYPGMLAVNTFNELLVVDVLNTRVQKFDPLANYLTEIGGWGVTAGKLVRPKGVAVDGRDRVYISDSYMGVVQVFTDQGRLLGVLCSGKAVYRLTTPVGMAVSVDGRHLFVVEMRANRIRKLELTHR
jgi:DNA-binding beta-propeller fold protein YncE